MNDNEPIQICQHFGCVEKTVKAISGRKVVGYGDVYMCETHASLYEDDTPLPPPTEAE